MPLTSAEPQRVGEHEVRPYIAWPKGLSPHLADS